MMKKRKRKQEERTRDPWALRPDLQHLQNQINALAERVAYLERVISRLGQIGKP